ncbi:MAG TPA: hypothetical protein ENI90_06085 [Methylothermaceae bacterium]|nr:hypothetical protein [Methylothermaceae bacterium]
MENWRLQRLFEAHGLRDGDLFFLDLIPLVEMIWADGYNQEGEIRILEDCARRHMAELNQLLGHQVVTKRHLRDFLQRFVHRRPSPALLAELRQIACHRLRRRARSGQADKAREVLDQCIDIAAACVTRYPYGLRERIMERERELLSALFHQLSPRSGRGKDITPSLDASGS